MIKRCLSRRSTLAGWGLGVVVAVAALLFAAPAPAATPPAIDGNLTDMITFVNQVIAEKIGNGLTKSDPAKDVCKSDASIYPCPAGLEEPCPSDPVSRTYFKNGYDLVLAVAAYDQSTQTLYLGTRAAGVIGDVDGDQTAGDGGCAPPPGKLDINDGAGVGNNETYLFNVDFDCGQNGVNELRIEVDNGTLYVNDVAQPAGNWAFNGSDLEIKIPGQALPAMWSISVKTGASEDGLEEETIQERTPPPPLDLSIVKSAEPTVICPNGNTVFTVTVTNTGAAALDVNLVDALPAQLSFVSLDPSSDFVLNPNPPATPQNLVFATLNMAPGEVKIAKFTAQASADCFGAVENVATVTGVFNSRVFAGRRARHGGPARGPRDGGLQGPAVRRQRAVRGPAGGLRRRDLHGDRLGA